MNIYKLLSVAMQANKIVIIHFIFEIMVIEVKTVAMHIHTHTTGV